MQASFSPKTRVQTLAERDCRSGDTKDFRACPDIAPMATSRAANPAVPAPDRRSRRELSADITHARQDSLPAPPFRPGPSHPPLRPRKQALLPAGNTPGQQPVRPRARAASGPAVARPAAVSPRARIGAFQPAHAYQPVWTMPGHCQAISGACGSCPRVPCGRCRCARQCALSRTVSICAARRRGLVCASLRAVRACLEDGGDDLRSEGLRPGLPGAGWGEGSLHDTLGRKSLEGRTAAVKADAMRVMVQLSNRRGGYLPYRIVRAGRASTRKQPR